VPEGPAELSHGAWAASPQLTPIPPHLYSQGPSPSLFTCFWKYLSVVTRHMTLGPTPKITKIIQCMFPFMWNSTK
jgi:hypothetical protein